MLQKIASDYLNKIAKDFYNSIVHTETGSFQDPWIRTKHAPPEGSSAYGPAQITRTKATDYFEQYPKMMAPHHDFYFNVLKPMHDNFLKYGRSPHKEGYDPKWEYGGKGNPLTDVQKQQYEQMMRTMMEIDKQRAHEMLPNGTPEQILNKRIALWRGKPQKDDTRYYRDFYSVYNKSKAPIVNSTVKPKNVTTIKPSNVYTVQAGDSLSKIVANRGIKGATNIYNMVNKIKKINNMNNDVIRPNQQLKLPEGL